MHDGYNYICIFIFTGGLVRTYVNVRSNIIIL